MYVAEFTDLGFFNVHVGTVLCVVVFFLVGYYVGMVYRFCFVWFCFVCFVLLETASETKSATACGYNPLFADW